MLSGYGLRFLLEYQNWDGITIRDEVYKLGYSGAVEEVAGQGEPFLLSRENEQDVFTFFRGSNATLNLSSQVSKKYFELFEGDERSFYLNHREAGVVKWTGWIIPDVYSESYSSGPYQTSVKFSDGIGSLKNIPFPDINDNGYTGTSSEKDVLVACLGTLGLELDIWIFASLHEERMNPQFCPLLQSFVNVEAFTKLDQAEISPLSCYEVLEKMLVSWNAVIFQEDNRWVFVREPELSGTLIDAFIYDYLGEDIGSGPFTLTRNFAGEGIELHGADLQTERAYKKLSVSQDFGGLLVPNGNFAINGDLENYTPAEERFPILIWRLKDWTYVNLTEFPYSGSLGRVRRVEESTGRDQINNYVNIYDVVRKFSDPVGYIESKPAFIKQEIGNLINISLKMRCNTRGSNKKLVEAYFNIAVQCGTKWLGLDSEGAYEWQTGLTRIRWKVGTVMAWETISIPALPVPEDGELSIRLYQIVQVGSVKSVEYVCDYDDIQINLGQNEALNNTKVYYKTTNPETYTNSLPDVSIELGDALTVMSQNAKIIDGLPSAKWVRKGKNELEPIAKILAREYLNQYQSITYSLSGGRCRADLKILANYQDLVNDTSRKFIIGGGSYSAKSGTWNPTFLEINQAESTTEIRQVFEPNTETATGAAGGGDTGSGQVAQDPDALPDGVVEVGEVIINTPTSININNFGWQKNKLTYFSNLQTVTVLAPNATFPRVDLFYGIDSDTVQYIAGTAGTSSVYPSVPSGGIALVFIQRNADGTTLPIYLPEYDPADHNTLTNLQGGTPTERYHITGPQAEAIESANNPTEENPFATIGDLVLVDLSDYVTIDTPQTITGAKTFSLDTVINGSLRLDTRENAKGNFATFSSTGEFQERTATEVASDLNIGTLKTANDTTIGSMKYNGNTQEDGSLYGGIAQPIGSTILNYDGNFRASDIISIGSMNAIGGFRTGGQILVPNIANGSFFGTGALLNQTLIITVISSSLGTNANAVIIATNNNGTFSMSVLHSNNLIITVAAGAARFTNNSGSTLDFKVNRMRLI